LAKTAQDLLGPHELELTEALRYAVFLAGGLVMADNSALGWLRPSNARRLDLAPRLNFVARPVTGEDGN
jgi:hypothetical protein